MSLFYSIREFRSRKVRAIAELEQIELQDGEPPSPLVCASIYQEAVRPPESYGQSIPKNLQWALAVFLVESPLLALFGGLAMLLIASGSAYHYIVRPILDVLLK